MSNSRTTVIFVRHAQSQQPYKDDRTRPLSRAGLYDRKVVLEVLQGRKIDAFLSSPYVRSVDTIRPAAEFFGKEIKTDERFRERENGPEAYYCREARWNDFSFAEKGGESLRSVQKRNIRALHDVLRDYAGKTVVIGTHGTALSAILNYYDDTFDIESFRRIVDWMPYVVELVFEGDELVGKKELAHVEKEQQSYDFTKITACGEFCIGCSRKNAGECPGCIEADGVVPEWSDSGRCRIHACTREYGVQFCGLCAQFPCEKIPKLIPWNEHAVEHLDRMREMCLDQARNDSRDWLAGMIDDQEVLADLAMNHPGGLVRRAVVGKVTDPEVLAYVALHDESRQVRKVAVGRLSDEEVLAEVARTDDYDVIQIMAVDRITRRDLLLQVALEDPYGHGGGCAAEELRGDEEALKKIMLEGKAAMARASASYYSHDQETLALVACCDEDPYPRRCATRHLLDQEVLFAVYSQDPSARVRAVAAGKITDSERLFKIAMEDPEREVRMAAAGAVRDEETMVRIIRSKQDPYTRAEAAKHITDPDLAMVLFEKETEHVVLYHLTKLVLRTPEGLDMLLKHENPSTRGEGVSMLDDPERLYEIALKDPVDCVKREALIQLNVMGRQDLLKKLVKEHKKWSDQLLVVVSYINEQEDLKEIFPYISGKVLAEMVVGRLEDLDFLRENCRTHPDRDVCLCAALKAGDMERARELGYEEKK
ncbi:MAG: histidine phosphatase family protein [Clostridiales bacterium]|nr:histidine phosphatase family protein [Clostridiales bacterium]